MMSYELAKELKEAGLIQEGNGWFRDKEQRGNVSMHGTFGIFKTDNLGDVVYEPTLSELIRDCGEEVFFELSKLKDGWGANNHYHTATGTTPEEAVGLLLLKLIDNV